MIRGKQNEIDLPDESFSNITTALSVNPLLCIEQLQVHVSVERNQDPLVLHAHLSFTMTGLSIRSMRKGLGLMGMGCAVAAAAAEVCVDMFVFTTNKQFY